MPEHDDERGLEAVLPPPRACGEVHGAEAHVIALGVRGRLEDDLGEELLAAHCETYVDAFCVGALDDGASRKIGLPWSEDLVERTLHEVSGTILTADLGAF